MTEKEFLMKDKKLREQEKSWKREKNLQKRKSKLKQEREQLENTGKMKLSTTKLIVLFILCNCTLVEAYSMWVMYKLMDLSALYSLIAAVVGESITFIAYAAKSTKENTVGGITYEKAMSENCGKG